MAAILVMWPGTFIQTFVPRFQWGTTWNLALSGQVVSEEKMFETVDHNNDNDNHDNDNHDNGRPSMGIL